jgi:Dolichyl-phosphate-mannose-protein mannosyltransferase
MSAVSTTTAAPAVRVSVRALAGRAALPLLFVASAAAQIAQGGAHVTTTIFDDELLYSKLAQSIAAGHGLTIRGAHYAFPAPVASLLQAPAWLFGSMPEGYATAKVLNALLMSVAVFPAYALARRVVRPSFALVVAAATVATPAMVYHAYLMSEAAAYPIFLTATYVVVRALEQPSRRLAIAVPLVCAVAIGTRVQFVVLPVAYVIGVAICSRRRVHLIPIGALALLGLAALLLPGAAGSYGAASGYHYADARVAHWALRNLSLAPYSLGLAVVPGALLGLAYAAARPRTRAERAFAVVAVTAAALFVAQAALISANEAHRPLERYLFYVTPLVFTAFFAYVERGAPRKLLYFALAAATALALSQVSFSGMTGTAGFFFDSVTETGYARAAYEFGLANASLLFSLLPMAMCALAVVLPLRRAGAAITVAATAIALQLWIGAGVASTDHLATHWAYRTFATAPADWLDRMHAGHARQLVLPDSTGFYGTQLETWNRDVSGLDVLQTPAPDGFARSVARVRTDGTLEVDGRPATPQLLVVNDSGSQLGLQGTVVARPRPELIAYRIPAGPHVRWLEAGVFPDRWSGAHVRYQVWPAHPARHGRYVVALGLPAGYTARAVAAFVPGQVRRVVTVHPGRRVRLVLPVTGVHPTPLRLSVDVPLGALSGRVLGVRVLTLRYER